jgi:transcription antitermination factor NusG
VAGAACVKAGRGRRSGAMYWACARLEGQHQRLALYCLGLRGFETYLPRVRLRQEARAAPLFPGYCFIRVALQWTPARWAPGVMALLMNGAAPAKVADCIINELRGRERGGLVVLPSSPSSPLFLSGDKVRVTSGPLVGFRGLVDGMRPHERVAVLLELLGSTRAIEMSADNVAMVRE